MTLNISKTKLVWKFLMGGREGVLDYALDVANNLAAQIPEAKQEDLKGYLDAANRILNTLDSISWLCPSKWLTAYGATLSAFADLVSALSDLQLTADEVTHVSAAFQAAYAAWRAE